MAGCRGPLQEPLPKTVLRQQVHNTHMQDEKNLRTYSRLQRLEISSLGAARWLGGWYNASGARGLARSTLGSLPIAPELAPTTLVTGGPGLLPSPWSLRRAVRAVIARTGAD